MPAEPASNIQSRLQELVTYAREDLDTELKGWLDIWTKDDPATKENQSNLAQAILALANHGGGYILIGFSEVGATWEPDPNRPVDLKGYSQDAVSSIVHRFAEPAFQCQVHHISHLSTGEIFPVIIVPSGHKTPIRAKIDGSNGRHVKVNCYYIRRPGPKSEQIQTAQEWDELISRCVRTAREELLGDIRSLLYGINTPVRDQEQEAKAEFENWINAAKTRFEDRRLSLKPNEYPERYDHGFWTLAYRIVGDFEPLHKPDFLDLLNKVDTHLTGWPVWTIFTKPELAPYVHEDVIECWLKNVSEPDPSISDFWWASPKGMMFLLRGYDNDTQRIAEYYKIQPGTTFDPTVPIWRVGECLLHAERLANALPGGPKQITVRASWSGLSDRVLTNVFNPGSHFLLYRQSRTDKAHSEIVITPEQINSNLPEVLSNVLQPLYDLFGLFKMPVEVIQQELTKLKTRQY